MRDILRYLNSSSGQRVMDNSIYGYPKWRFGWVTVNRTESNRWSEVTAASDFGCSSLQYQQEILRGKSSRYIRHTFIILIKTPLYRPHIYNICLIYPPVKWPQLSAMLTVGVFSCHINYAIFRVEWSEAWFCGVKFLMS